MKKRILIAICALLFSISAYSGPARKGIVYLQQPDGTSFAAIMRGDEFMKIVTTSDGYAVMQDETGWWCYADYDNEGRKRVSGCHVGDDAPEAILSSSRIIPYSKLSMNAMKRRSLIHPEEEPVMARILKQRSTDTKGGTETVAVKHGIIILAQFKDVKFTYSKEDFVSLLTQKGYSRSGATGSAKEYFDAQFNGLFEFSFDVSNIVTLPSAMVVYGGNDEEDADKAPEQMIIDACRLADADVDFSRYDDDSDGVVDNVFVFFAGGDEAEGAGSDCIWSHAWYIYSGAGQNVVLDGKKIDRYACTSELSRRYSGDGNHRDVLAGIGTFCHEYFHTFGIPDMYDTDYEGSGGHAAGLWAWTSLMDAGNQNNDGNTPPYLNAVEREYLGISKPITIKSDGGYTLDPIHRNGNFYRIDTDYENEYYLLECRSEEGWDKYIGGSGMLVYHIDKSTRSAGYSESYGRDLTAAQRWNYMNEINCRPDHQCVDLIEADMRRDSFSEAEKEDYSASLKIIRGIFFPDGGANSITSDGKPGFTFWSGQPAETSVTNIRKSGDDIAFNVIGYSDFEIPPAAINIKTEAFMDAAIIRFESDRAFEGDATITWGRTGNAKDTLKVSPYETGKYSITLENLTPDNKTYTVDIFFETSGITGEAVSTSFMTKKTPVVSWPFIYMNGVSKNSDGTLPEGSKLPLRVYNSGSVARITWEFNGRAIKNGGDGYFTVSESGELKARITYEDGSEETLMKEIIIGKEGAQ